MRPRALNSRDNVHVENAHRKRSLKRGGARQRLDLNVEQPVEVERSELLLALDEALDRLQVLDSDKAQLVKLRYFAGMTIEQTAETLAISVTTANRWWKGARTWLHEEIRRGEDLSVIAGRRCGPGRTGIAHPEGNLFAQGEKPWLLSTAAVF